jgi:multiple sugar transport system permease protein/cellobiose transport system permease protein
MKIFRAAFSFIVLIVISIISIYPFYMMVMMSTYRAEAIFTGIKLLPGNYWLINLNEALKGNFVRSLFNSLLVSVIATFVSVQFSAMAGYALNIYRFKFRRAAFRIIMATMAMPMQISLVGYLTEMRFFRLTNTLAPIIICHFASAFGVFWMTKYIEGSLSKELVESARIDGCHEIRVFYQIVIPCILPAVTTLTLLSFLTSWNSYLMPLIFLNRPVLMTIPLFINSLQNAYRTDYGAQLAALLLATVPVLVLFIIGSRSFIKGLTAGAVKG